MDEQQQKTTTTAEETDNEGHKKTGYTNGGKN